MSVAFTSRESGCCLLTLRNYVWLARRTVLHAATTADKRDAVAIGATNPADKHDDVAMGATGGAATAACNRRTMPCVPARSFIISCGGISYTASSFCGIIFHTACVASWPLGPCEVGRCVNSIGREGRKEGRREEGREGRREKGRRRHNRAVAGGQQSAVFSATAPHGKQHTI